MKIKTLTIIVVLTAIILVTAGAFNSPALAKPITGTKSKHFSGGGKTGGGLVLSTSGVGSSFLGSAGKAKTSSSSSTGP